MIHPLAEDFGQLKDIEVENRLQDLTKKYWLTNNPQVRHQISTLLEIYKEELNYRRTKAFQQQYQNRDKGLDNLIKVS
jgi:hypothetical protein